MATRSSVRVGLAPTSFLAGPTSQTELATRRRVRRAHGRFPCGQFTGSSGNRDSDAPARPVVSRS